MKKKIFFPKTANAMPEHIAPGKQQPKFERNPCIRFRDNGATDGRTDDGQKIPYHDLCWQSQAELINLTMTNGRCPTKSLSLLIILRGNAYPGLSANRSSTSVRSTRVIPAWCMANPYGSRSRSSMFWKQDTQGPWQSAWPFASWNQHSFMDNGTIAEVTYLQSTIYF